MHFFLLGITEDQGACIAKPSEVRTFKPFFIQLELPYKASRFETISIRATIFNYLNADQIVCIRVWVFFEGGGVKLNA